MAKTIITIDDGLLDYIKSDAAKERRSMAGQICKLIELSREHGGYEGLVKRLDVQDAKESAKDAPATRGRKRTKPQKITWDNCRGGSDCAAILYNADDDKALIVKTNKPERDIVIIEQMLKSGKFPIADVQEDYSGKCCKFEVLSGFGDTVEEVRSNCDAAEFYGEVYDCMGDADNPVIEQPDNSTQSADQDAVVDSPGAVNPPTTQEILRINWDSLETEDALKQYLSACDNADLREVAEKYIQQVYAPSDGVTYNTIFDDDVLPIMDRFRRKYRK